MLKRYIILDGVFPITWFAPIDHKAMAGFIRSHGEAGGMFGGETTSAANYEVENGRVIIEGYSRSLNMGPGPDDARILARHLGL